MGLCQGRHKKPNVSQQVQVVIPSAKYSPTNNHDKKRKLVCTYVYAPVITDTCPERLQMA